MLFLIRYNNSLLSVLEIGVGRGDPRDIANDDGLYRIPVDIGKRRTVGYNIRGNQEPHLAVSEIVRTR
ncbi:hypothetical protein V1477_011196 [Vespula maculifrons]|uniref:Uncharacterized protein n=1 Tax=Vespula maculifrons TaxID=7453 RepID=A0ABD2C450_VESMC